MLPDILYVIAVQNQWFSCKLSWFHWTLYSEFASFKIRCTAEGDFSSAPFPRFAGLEQKPRPIGIKSEEVDSPGTYSKPYPKRTEAVLFGGLSPPNKNTFLRVLSACGENLVSDKSDFTFMEPQSLERNEITEKLTWYLI
jgi:hypothetical protein